MKKNQYRIIWGVYVGRNHLSASNIDIIHTKRCTHQSNNWYYVISLEEIKLLFQKALLSWSWIATNFVKKNTLNLKWRMSESTKRNSQQKLSPDLDNTYTYKARVNVRKFHWGVAEKIGWACTSLCGCASVYLSSFFVLAPNRVDRSGRSGTIRRGNSPSRRCKTRGDPCHMPPWGYCILCQGYRPNGWWHSRHTHRMHSNS